MKKYIIAVIVVILAIGGYFYFKKSAIVQNPAPISTEEISTTTPVATSSSPVSVPTNTDRDAAWAVLQNYIAFAKTKNIGDVTSLSYQISDTCKNYSKSETNKTDCDNKMISVANIGSQLVKNDYTNVWSDDKQIILSTKFSRADAGNDIAGYLHGVIFFVKDKGVIKLLSFNPARGIFLPKTATSTDAQIQAKLEAAVKDSDQDGLEDQVENCIRVDTECTKTDPTKRDTNSNGFWDGVEALFYK